MIIWTGKELPGTGYRVDHKNQYLEYRNFTGLQSKIAAKTSTLTFSIHNVRWPNDTRNDQRVALWVMGVAPLEALLTHPLLDIFLLSISC